MEVVMASALKGVRILDFSRLLPGPYCTMLLGDLGADVIKVEESKQGDYLRWRAPYVNGEGAPFMSLNRNKRSLTLNLKHLKGQELLRRLVAISDVLFEQFRPGVMKRLNSDYETLKKINPRLIYVALSGYGQDGPYVNMTGHDINYLSIAGITGLNGPADGPPVPTGIQIADLSSGQFVAMAILAALHHVDKTGDGQYIDISMTDGVVSWQSLAAAYLFAGGEPQVRGKTRYTGG